MQWNRFACSACCHRKSDDREVWLPRDAEDWLLWNGCVWFVLHTCKNIAVHNAVAISRRIMARVAYFCVVMAGGLWKDVPAELSQDNILHQPVGREMYNVPVLSIKLVISTRINLGSGGTHLVQSASALRISTAYNYSSWQLHYCVFVLLCTCYRSHEVFLFDKILAGIIKLSWWK